MPYQFKREPLTTSEQDKLINSCSKQIEKMVIYTLMDSGVREAELTNIKKDNIQWQRGSIIIWGKGDKRRVVPMTARVKALLENHFSFNEEIGLSLSKVYRTVKGVAEKAKITKNVSPHVLRHTFAVNTLQKGVSIASLSKLLGHSSVQTTLIYLNVTNDEALEEFKRKEGREI